MRWLAASLVLLIAASCAGETTVTPTIPGTDQFVAAGSRWKRLAPAPTARTEATGAAAHGRIFVVGGFVANGDTVRLVEIYNVARNSWRRGPRLPVAVNHAMAATVDGRVYVVGGRSPAGVSRRAFVLRDGRWRELPRMPAPRTAGGAAGIAGRLYVAGGKNGSGLATSMFVYNPKTQRWSRRPGMPMPREHLGVASYRGSLFAIGGRVHGMAHNKSRSERFRTRTGHWTRMAPMPTARGGLDAAATTNGLVVAAGGEGPDGTFDDVEAFRVSTSKWLRLPNMPTARHGLVVVSVGNKVFVITGGPQPGLYVSRANQMIDLAGL